MCVHVCVCVCVCMCVLEKKHKVVIGNIRNSNTVIESKNCQMFGTPVWTLYER